jgi:hypothetical protein
MSFRLVPLALAIAVLATCRSPTETTDVHSLSGAWFSPNPGSSASDSIVLVLDDSTPTIIGYGFLTPRLDYYLTGRGTRVNDDLTITLAGVDFALHLYGPAELRGTGRLSASALPISVFRFPPPPAPIPGRWVLTIDRFNGIDQSLFADTFFLGAQGQLRESSNNGLCGSSIPGAYRVIAGWLYYDVRYPLFFQGCNYLHLHDSHLVGSASLLRHEEFLNGIREQVYEKR